MKVKKLEMRWERGGDRADMNERKIIKGWRNKRNKERRGEGMRELGKKGGKEWKNLVKGRGTKAKKLEMCYEREKSQQRMKGMIVCHERQKRI